MKNHLLRVCFVLVMSGLTNSMVNAVGISSLAELSVAPSQRAALIVKLRNEGPSGLQQALDFRDQLERKLIPKSEQDQTLTQNAQNSAAPKELLDQAIDQIAGQRYGSFSKLYWYTDWDKAVAAGKTENKPILVLKMLGNLTDEFSCANSRFFRTTLYVDPSISPLMRDKYVLYWSSVRPVPKISIDFGDGRKLERTITGNSAHYVVDTDGNVIDCLPGLNSPATFRNWLSDVSEVTIRLSRLSNDLKLVEIARYHRNHLLVENLLPQIATWPSSEKTPTATTQLVSQPAFPPAKVAMARAMSKGFIEGPLVLAVQPNTGIKIEAISSSEQLSQQIAPARLSQESLQILRLENPTEMQQILFANRGPTLILGQDSKQADSKDNMIATLCQTIVEDEKMNQQFHSTLHGWLAENPAKSLDELNERVYSELFLTPSSDPWLGLVNQDAYTGLMHGGLQLK